MIHDEHMKILTRNVEVKFRAKYTFDLLSLSSVSIWFLKFQNGNFWSLKFEKLFEIVIKLFDR